MAYTIIHIEDDTGSQELIHETLSIYGYNVLCYGSAEIACDKMASERPDLIICDIMLPGMSGLDFLEKIHESTNDVFYTTPFIFITALEDRGSILRGRKLGADDYLTKPVDIEILIEIVKHRLGQVRSVDLTSSSIPVSYTHLTLPTIYSV